MRLINIMAGYNLAASNFAVHLGLFIVANMIPLPEIAEDDEICKELVPDALDALRYCHGIIAFLIFVPTILDNFDGCGMKWWTALG